MNRPADAPTSAIATLPALLTTAGFIAADFVGVGIIGDQVATWAGFDSSWLMPISALICIAAGYAAARQGMWGATAGSMVTGFEMTAYLLTGDRFDDIVPPELKYPVGVIIVMVVAAGGALLGALGGWLARRRPRQAVAVVAERVE